MEFFLSLLLPHIEAVESASLPFLSTSYSRTSERLCADDPYAVADKWLLKENLPMTYRQQVVEFILQNSGQNNFVPDPAFRDPYTGGKHVLLYMFWQSFKVLSDMLVSLLLLTLDFTMYQVMHMYPGNRLRRTVCTLPHRFDLLLFSSSFFTCTTCKYLGHLFCLASSVSCHNVRYIFHICR